jgi:glycosyltransferase involved in cell wall biosynthesis
MGEVAQRSHGTESGELQQQRDGQRGAHRRNVGGPRVHVIVPALDEEAALPGVLRALAGAPVDTVTVVDNGSRDGTAAVARAGGARLVHEPRRGYGAACLAGIAALEGAAAGDVVVFLDADGSDDPSQVGRLVAPIIEGRAQLVIGSRVLGRPEPGALPVHARAGNALAVVLIRWLTGQRYTDLGPFRAIRRDALEGLRMRDRDFGWTVEMQLRAARQRLAVQEVAVPYRRRIGRSKISGTLTGSVRAGAKILWTVVRHVV